MAEILPLGRMSKRIGFPREELKGMAEAGLVPCLRAGKQLFFCPSAVLESLAALASRSLHPAIEAVEDEAGLRKTVCIDENGG
jgi:hypothetical protein